MIERGKLLRIHDVARCLSLGRDVLLKETRGQFTRQLSCLKSLQIRHCQAIQCFTEVIESSSYSNFDLDGWVQSSKQAFQSVFNQMEAEGAQWNGRGICNRSLVSPLNEICYHNIYAQLCLDCLSKTINNTPCTLELNSFLSACMEDIGSFSKEKFGVCPDINIKGELNLLVVPSYFEFAVVELVKNSIKSVIDRYGALNLDDTEEPIEIMLYGDSKRMVLTDKGCGMSKDVAESCFDAFFSTTARDASANKEPSYHYSRDFGAPFSGAGIGLLKTKAYLEFHDANISLQTKLGEGTEISIVF